MYSPRSARTPKLSTVSVIAWSGSRSPFDVTAACSAGVNAYLVKPGGIDALVAYVGALLSFWVDAAQLPRAM